MSIGTSHSRRAWKEETKMEPVFDEQDYEAAQKQLYGRRCENSYETDCVCDLAKELKASRTKATA